MPPEARWQNLQNRAARPDIATLIDDAILAVERDNPNLKGKLPRDYARRGIAPEKMKGLIDLIAGIGFKGDRAKARDTLGRVYEYFLGKFAQAEGKLGGEFFTPRCIVRLLVEMLEPYEGRVYDPCCGSAGMFVQSERFVEAHGGQKTDISIFGQESNPTTWGDSTNRALVAFRRLQHIPTDGTVFRKRKATRRFQGRSSWKIYPKTRGRASGTCSSFTLRNQCPQMAAGRESVLVRADRRGRASNVFSKDT